MDVNVNKVIYERIEMTTALYGTDMWGFKGI